jgi:DNA polymerase III delta subunit
VLERPKVSRASERADFVKAEFRRAGRQADQGAVQALLDSIGGDLRELASAVDQLAADTEGRINASVVARYYRGRAEATGFSVADHAVEGRLPEALEQLRWALATGTAPVLITSALANGVRLLGRVGAAGNKNSMSLAAEVGTRRAWRSRCRRPRRRTRRSRGTASAPDTRWNARSCASSRPAAVADAAGNRNVRRFRCYNPGSDGHLERAC